MCWTGQGHSKVAQGCAQVDYLIRRSRQRGSLEAVSRQQQNASQLLDERLDENLRASYVQSGPQAIASAVEEEPEQGDDDAEADDERALAIPMATIRHFVSHSPVTETRNPKEATKQRSKDPKIQRSKEAKKQIFASLLLCFFGSQRAFGDFPEERAAQLTARVK